MLGTQFTKAVEVVQGVPTYLFFVLGLAIALLALAALPGRAAPTLRIHKLLAYHRELIALAGHGHPDRRRDQLRRLVTRQPRGD